MSKVCAELFGQHNFQCHDDNRRVMERQERRKKRMVHTLKAVAERGPPHSQKD